MSDRLKRGLRSAAGFRRTEERHVEQRRASYRHTTGNDATRRTGHECSGILGELRPEMYCIAPRHALPARINITARHAAAGLAGLGTPGSLRQLYVQAHAVCRGRGRGLSHAVVLGCLREPNNGALPRALATRWRTYAPDGIWGASVPRTRIAGAPSAGPAVWSLHAERRRAAQSSAEVCMGPSAGTTTARTGAEERPENGETLRWIHPAARFPARARGCSAPGP